MSRPVATSSFPPGPDPRIAAAIAGDRGAASALLEELLPRIRNLCRYFVRGDADADDAAQVVLVEILRSLPSYRGESSLRAWADRITARHALAFVRRRRAELAMRADSAELALVRDPSTTDVYAMRRDVARLLDELPDDQREAVVMHHVVGLSASELADELGVPFETARSRLRLGMKKLREGMGCDADEGAR